MHDHVSDFFNEVVPLDLKSHVDHFGGFGLGEHWGRDRLGKGLLFDLGVMDYGGGPGWGVLLVLFDSVVGVDRAAVVSGGNGRGAFFLFIEFAEFFWGRSGFFLLLDD